MPRRESSPVRAMNEAVILKSVEVFPNGDLGGLKAPGQRPDQNPAIMLQNFQDRAAALFVQQTVPLRALHFATPIVQDAPISL